MLRQSIKQVNRKRLMSSLVEFKVLNTARRVTLNRPKKLNALNNEMCEVILPTMQEYAKSKSTNLVILDSSCSPRAFCAGGDVVAVTQHDPSIKDRKQQNFFELEYSLNWLLASYPKPVVTIMDGITMGGGVGLSIHNPFRIATENTRWAMPEMDIGLYPDVGTTFALPRLLTVANSDGQFGYYLCLTGDILSGADAYLAGLASHYVTSDNIDNVRNRLSELPPSDNPEAMFDMTNKALLEFESPLPEGHQFAYSAEKLAVIESVFNLDYTVKELIEKLQDISTSSTWSPEAKSFASSVKNRLNKLSIVSMEVTREQFRRNYFNDIQSALKQDLVTSSNMAKPGMSEFPDAVRHKLIQRNKTPFNWKQHDISTSKISSLLSSDPTSQLSLREIDGFTFKKYPHHAKYSLPPASRVESYITGSDESGRSFAVTKQEAIKYFSEYDELSKGKVGVKNLVSFIIDMKCNVDAAGYLTWKP
ncbi:HGR024Cp [Eremothecium sinecaudum]|uniref:3-hydroxyisobutyryl-CoA hydrolase n=1 Tax=Eremothecium sinecaudum TaxID=45286 RepID=A0A109V030_9SACH|nr:HGR024Cp [Eremothecium sinecaudum]AMD22363.1 HGR024Cp [Eremothecium sinecaudum]